MSLIERTTQTDANGYREVSLAYRIARAAAREQARASAQGERIACPGLDASRSLGAYGMYVLPGTRGKDLKAWADALGVNSVGIKTVAYLSGPFWSIPRAFLQGRFDDRAVNGGFLRSLKRRTNTGVLTTGAFDPDMLRSFVRAVRPDLDGTEMNEDWLYSERSACQYIDMTMLPAIRKHNASNADRSYGPLARRLGLFLSTFEMRSLLLGTLAQPIPRDPRNPSTLVNAIHLRDVYDLYKYGFLPAVAEERLMTAGLLEIPAVHTITTDT